MDETPLGEQMSGVYIHIPFCKSRCLYCDFFSTTQLKRRTAYVDALLSEWSLRYTNDSISTIYFGGGTPSLLSPNEIGRLLDAICPDPSTQEITLEANPGDLTAEYLHDLSQTGVNRLSIGIQSFDNHLLRCIGRRHSAEEAIRAVYLAQDSGFENISIDLMYGLPKQDLAMWQLDIHKALSLHVPHISTYCLTYEDGTPLSRMLARGELVEIDETTENQMYDYIVQQLSAAGYEHYEVSNFSLHNQHSRHNSNYWNNTPYIGLGAGAHSYDGSCRSWNIENIDSYIMGVQCGKMIRETEILSDTDLYNERIMLGLRTANGIDYKILRHPELATPYIERGLLRIDTVDGKARLVATLSGIHILNQIIRDFME